MSTLTAEQRARIEHNRLAALQRRKAWQKQQQMQCNLKQDPSNPFRNNRKRKYHEIQSNHKLPLQPQKSQNIPSNDTCINHNTKHCSPQKKRRKLRQNTITPNAQTQIHTKSASNSFQNTKRNYIHNAEYQSKPNRPKQKNKSKHNNLITNYMNDTKNRHKKQSKAQKRNKNSKYTKKRSNRNAKYVQHKRHKQWTPLSKQVLFNRLSHSKFRSKFKLGAKEINIVHTKNIESHAFDFVTKRLSAAKPKNDGKQTPMRGHPVFIAQHATATCCRTCLSKWHYIDIGKALTDEQVIYMVEVILHWIKVKTPMQNI